MEQLSFFSADLAEPAPGDLAGLLAARRHQRAGRRVVLLESAAAVGGAIAAAHPEDAPALALNAGAEAFATSSGAVDALVAELGLADRVVAPREGLSSRVVSDAGVHRAPRGALLGVPGNPLAADVREVLGTAGALRAALERLTSPGPVPILTPHPAPRRANSMYNPYFPDVGPSRDGHMCATSTPPTPPLYRSPSSVHTQPSRSSSHTHSVPTPPSTDLLHAHASASQPQCKRRPSLSSSTSSPYPYPASASAAGTHPLDALFPDPLHAQDPDPAPQAVVLRPALNNHVSQIATLAHSNHTLSPYTRALEHFTVRSVPPRSLAPPPAPPAPVRARRRRSYRLGGVGTGAGATDPASVPPSPPRPRARGGAGADADASCGAAHAAGLGAPASPVLPSEFDAEEMDRYFRARDELEHYPPELHPSHVRRRRHASYQAS